MKKLIRVESVGGSIAASVSSKHIHFSCHSLLLTDSIFFFEKFCYTIGVMVINLKANC
jgi:hypothetical protein